MNRRAPAGRNTAMYLLTRAAPHASPTHVHRPRLDFEVRISTSFVGSPISAQASASIVSSEKKTNGPSGDAWAPTMRLNIGARFHRSAAVTPLHSPNHRAVKRASTQVEPANISTN